MYLLGDLESNFTTPKLTKHTALQDSDMSADSRLIATACIPPGSAIQSAVVPKTGKKLFNIFHSCRCATNGHAWQLATATRVYASIGGSRNDDCHPRRWQSLVAKIPVAALARLGPPGTRRGIKHGQAAEALSGGSSRCPPDG